MGYEKHLIDLISPLGVYSFKDGSASRGGVAALGAVLDDAEDWLFHCEREAVLITASQEGLTNRASLFASRPEGEADELRDMLISLYQIADDGFTLEAVNKVLSGVGAEILRCGDGLITIWFPKIPGVPDGFLLRKRIIEDVLPCHLGVFYHYNFITWEEIDRYELTWGKAGGMTWHEFSIYRKAERA